MKVNTLIILAVILLLTSRTGAQPSCITLDLPHYPGKTATVMLKRGITIDTLCTAPLDATGQVTFTVPEIYTAHTGMVTLQVEEATLDFILSAEGEDLTIRCFGEHIHGGNTQFSGSPENESLQTWFLTQMKRLQKLTLLSDMERVYDDGDDFLHLVEREKTGLLAEQQAFGYELQQSPLYAARFIESYNFFHGQVSTLDYADSNRLASVRQYVRDSLDINNLYTSGLWFQTINGLLGLYDNGSPFHRDFIGDMSVLLSKTNTDKIYTTLADNLISICEAMNWGDMQEELAYFLVNDGRIRQPEGKIRMLLTLYKLTAGSKAPTLTDGSNPCSTLLVFYESGCGNCENEMLSLKNNYPAIKTKGYEVVSISADVDEHIFRNISGSFPWENKLCDLKGFDGDNFENYGIIGTPTYFLIDKNGNVVGRYARLQDTGILN